MNKQVMGLFPQPIARYVLWAKTWQTQLDQVTVEYHGNHSYSVSDQVLDDFPELKRVLEQEVNDFALDVMGISDELRITQSWINVYKQGDSIHQHNHPNSIVSGTWYWSTPDTDILFHKHGLNSNTTWTMKLDQRVTDSRPFAVEINSIRVSENDVVLWPSYLQHSVPEHRDSQPRKTLSFNAMPKTWGSGLYRAF